MVSVTFNDESTLEAGECTDVQLRIHTSDYASGFDGTNDYSYQPGEWIDNERVALYDETDRRALRDRMQELEHYFSTVYPGKKDAEAVQRLKGLAERPGRAEMDALAEDWRPYRGMVALLMWHHYNNAAL